MYLCFAYRVSLFFALFAIGSVAYADEIKLKQNSSVVQQKEKLLGNNHNEERYNGQNKTKYNVLEKTAHSQKLNEKFKNITKTCENFSPLLMKIVISHIPPISYDNKMIVSCKNISEQFKFKGNDIHKNSSRKLLHKLEQMSVKYPGNSGIHHYIKKREAIDKWNIKSESNYSIVFVNHTKHVKYSSDINKSEEYLKLTTEKNVKYNNDLEKFNGTDIGYKSMKYCKQYKKYALEKTYASPLLPVLKPFVVGEQRKCRILPLVVGGTEASRGEFPHMAALGYNTGRQIHFLCGASLISEKYVLTAAHCAKTKWGFPVVVRFGVLNMLTERGQTIPVDDVVVHPNYNEPSVYDDIALVRTAEKLRLGHNLRPACLPEINTESDKPGSIVTAIGWGKVGYNLFLSPNLLKVKLKVVSLPKCEETFVSKERSIRLQRGISKNMICASGYLDPLHDTCQGDSGGPLQITYADDESGYCMHQIIGITSFGKQCGTGMPAVYTRVSAYIGWIESIIWPF